MTAVARLKRRAEFLAVAASRRRWVAPGLILQAARRPEDSDLPLQPRIGFTASRKIGIAVTRNRARRRLKAAADRVLPLHGAPGFDYVAIARNETVTRPFTELVQDLETALQRLSARNSGSPLPSGERVRVRGGAVTPRRGRRAACIRHSRRVHGAPSSRPSPRGGEGDLGDLINSTGLFGKLGKEHGEDRIHRSHPVGGAGCGCR